MATSSKMSMSVVVVLALWSCTTVNADAADQYIKTGTGIYDVTGPATEIDFMGYAFPGQNGQGIRNRLYARAFAFEDADGNKAIYASLDLCMCMLSFKVGVVEALEKAGMGTMYNHTNVLLSGIHTHSGPGAFSFFILYDISMFGINKKHIAEIVDGITKAIMMAHNNLASSKPAPITMAQGLLQNASRNRSPSSYLANPEAERTKYEKWGGDTDKNMTSVGFTDGNGNDIGSINIFAVHCTSFHNSHRLVSGDNKGYASYLLERNYNGNLTVPGAGKYVAAFGATNLGDVSPNTLGAWCNGTVGGVYCGNNRSLCNGRNEDCVSVGPAGFKDDKKSTEIIGQLQQAKALELLKAPTKTVSGKVQTIHTWVNMTGYKVDPKFTTTGQPAQTCRPAVGFSFAAGTTDGPGAFNFYQGDNCSTCLPFWNFVKNFIAKPTQEQIDCQHPKPILLDTGETKPHPWSPKVIPLQILKLGNLAIVASPTELTTMAGRRLRETVAEAFASHGADVTVVIAGLSNTYSGYTATYEEYQWQRYEAASTLFGPHQLAAYKQIFTGLVDSMMTGAPHDPGMPETNVPFVNFTLQPENIVDIHPVGKPFGTVLDNVGISYARGQMVNVTFVGANLRNDYGRGTGYMNVQMQKGNDWVTVMTDSNWETTVRWVKKPNFESDIICQWEIPEFMPTGTYRIQHQAHAKPTPGSDKLEAYSGTSATFKVVASLSEL